MIRNILFTDEAHFTRDGINNARNPHLLDRDNPHGTVDSNYQHRFSVNVWCGVIGDQQIGPYIFPQRLTGDIYANIVQDELPTLLDNAPLQTRQQIYRVRQKNLTVFKSRCIGNHVGWDNATNTDHLATKVSG